MSDLDVRQVDLDAALDRTYRRYAELRREANIRRRWVAGGAMVLLLAVGAVTFASLVGDEAAVRSPAPASAGPDDRTVTTVAEPETVIPPGYSLSVQPDGLRVVSRDGTVPVDPPDSGGPVSVAVSSTNLRIGELIEASLVRGGTVLRARFDCVSAADVIEEIRYVVRDGQVVLDAAISGDPGTVCPEGRLGPALSLPLDPPVAAGTEIVTGSLHTP